MEQRRPRVAADWIKIPASRQLTNLKEPTWVLIILLPSVSLTNSLLTLQMAVWGTRVTGLCLLEILRIRAKVWCNQESFLPAPTITPAASQLWNSTDLCRRNIVLLSCMPLAYGSAVSKPTALPPKLVPEALTVAVGKVSCKECVKFCCPQL